MSTAIEPKARRRPNRAQPLLALMARLQTSVARSFPDSGKVNWAILGPLLIVVAGIQFVMLRPPFPSDSLAYFQWAESLGGNNISHGTTRLGVLVPVRVAIEVFGTSEAAYHIVPFVFNLLLVGSTYAIGVKLAGSQFVGVAAAMTIASSTVVLQLNSQILPDTFAASWFALSLACFLSARVSSRRQYWMIAGAGAVGIAYLCREYVIFMAPLLLFLGWAHGWRRRDWALISCVWLAAFVGEMLLMIIVFGNPLARLRALAGFAERGASGDSELLVAYGKSATRWTVLRRGPKAFAVFDVGRLLVSGVPAGVMLSIFDRRRRGLWVTLLVWIAALWVPMMFLAGIVDPQTPRIRDNHVRYWFLIVPALFLLVASGATFVVRSIRNRKVASLAGVLAGLVMVGALVADFRATPPGEMFRGNGATQWDEVREWLRGDGADVQRVYTDVRMAKVLRLYTNEVFGDPIWDGEIVVFEEAGQFIPAPQLDGAVVLHELGLRYLRNRDLQVPDSYFDPGIDWEVVTRRADGSLTILMQTGFRKAALDYLSLAAELTTREIPLSSVMVAGDALMSNTGEVTTTGSDPQIRFSTDLAFGPNDLLVIELDASEPSTVQLYWKESGGSFSEENSTRQKVAPDTRYVVFDLSGLPVGPVLRLDPGEVAGLSVKQIFFIEEVGT